MHNIIKMILKKQNKIIMTVTAKIWNAQSN